MLITGIEQVEDTKLFPAQKLWGLASCEKAESSVPAAQPSRVLPSPRGSAHPGIPE